jgi:dienelactone hydrolase
MNRSTLCFGLGLALLPVAALAQVPADIAAELENIGRVVDAGRTNALYRPHQELMPIAGIGVERNIAYGPHALNTMDVFFSDPERGDGKPVIIFAHGGGFTGGSKHRDGSFTYDHFMIWAVENGMVGVNMDYRLAPDDPWPAAQLDLAAVIQWTKENIAQYGGDPDKIVLSGQSAGASLVANHVGHPQFHGPDGIGIVAAHFSSGTYEVTGPSDYYGDDPSKFTERSSLPGIVASNLPLMINRAELDPPDIAAQNDKLRDALCAAGRCPVYVYAEDHNHNSQLYAVRTDDTMITEPLLAFIRAHTD